MRKGALIGQSLPGQRGGDIELLLEEEAKETSERLGIRTAYCKAQKSILGKREGPLWPELGK